MYPTPEEIPTELVGPFNNHMVNGVDLSTIKKKLPEALANSLSDAEGKEDK